MQSNNNILIAQGGGPTNVINQSLVGIINGKKIKNLILLVLSMVLEELLTIIL